MGGLVSRYALAYMEKNGLNHNTKLWVSFDSPHLGANIPIGAQENLYFYGYKGRQDQAKIKFDENFRSPAARQMLIEQLDGKHEAFPYSTDLWRTANPNGQNNNSPFRQQFQTNLNSNGLSGSNGYPQNLRKIALINGTTNGTTTNGAGNKFLELAAFTIIKYGQIFGTPIQTNIKVATIDDSFLQNTGSSGQTFSGKVTIKRTGGLEVQNGSISRINSNPRGSMDNVQGGTFNTQGIIKDEFTLALNDAVDSQEWRTYLPNHAFIPSVSALAFKNPDFDWSTALERNLVCDPLNKEIYFDTYFAPSINQEHVFISSENANWLIKELQGIPQAPSFPLQAGLLSGTDKLCVGQTSTYSFADICKIPGTASWSVSSNLQIMSFTTTSVVVKGLADGQGVVTATFQNGMTVTKNVWVGAAPFSISRGIAESETCDGIKYHYVPFIINLPPGTSLKFNFLYPKVPYSQNGNVYTFQFLKNYSGYFSVGATATNSCGTYTVGYDEGFFINDCSWVGSSNSNSNTSNDTSYYKVYPNPSTDVVNVSLVDESQKPVTTSKIVAELYDFTGQSKQKVEVKHNIASINCSGLPRGIYILKIIIDGNAETHQVFVQ